MKKKDTEQLKNQKKREIFTSTITETPPQISSFSNILYEVLDTESDDIEGLKQAAKKAESLVSGWISICDDIGFYSFQTYLVDVLGNRKTLITYIKNMSTTATKKNMKELKQLANQCNQTTSISEAINICYQLQEKIKKHLSNPDIKPTTKFHQQEQKYNDIISSKHTSPTNEKKKSLSDEFFGGCNDTFEPEEFMKKMVTDEEEERQEKSRQETVKIICKKYYLSDEGEIIPKSSFDTLQEKLKRDDSFIE